MKEINILVKNILKPVLKGYSPIILIIRRNWINLIGEKYYEFCEPERTNFKKDKKNDGIIYIKCFNNVISFYIENNKLFILEKINSLFGYHLFSDIKIKQDPRVIKQNKNKSIILDVEKSLKIKDLTKNIDNEELKNSLNDFGNILFLNKSKQK